MKPRENPDTIFAAALGVFADYGFKKATLEDIAGALGMTKANLYHYARGKQDLYEQTVRWALLRWQGRVAEAVAREPDAERQFRTLCRTAVAFLGAEPHLARLLQRDPGIFPMSPENDPYADINAASMAMIRRILERGAAEGRFRAVDLESVPAILFSIYKMFINRMVVRPPARPPEALFAQTVELVCRGLLRPEGAGPPT